jgi:hypothetical protein
LSRFAAERIEHSGRIIVARIQNFRARRSEHRLFIRFYQVLDYSEQPFAQQLPIYEMSAAELKAWSGALFHYRQLYSFSSRSDGHVERATRLK